MYVSFGSPCVESINWVILTREDYLDPLNLWVISHKTLTNSTGVIKMVDSSTKKSYPPRSPQPPRVTRSIGKSSILAQITICFGRKMGKGRIYHGVKDPRSEEHTSELQSRGLISY